MCYGTTKYCNAFLKGLPCNNQDCLYLHDIGTRFGAKMSPTSPRARSAEEEISFTKEEMANIGPAKFAGHTGVLATGGSMRRVHAGIDEPDTPPPAGMPHQMQPDMSLPIAVPRAGPRTDSLWEGGLLGGPASPGAAARAGSWASTLLAPPGQPPAVDSTADFPELSAAPPDSARAQLPAANGATMAEQLARAAAGPGTPLTAASRLKARKEESVRKMQPISPAAKGGRASRLGASASSLSELEGSRPGSGQHDGSDGDANGQGEDAQHLAATMTWQVIDGDAAALERDVAALGGKGGKRVWAHGRNDDVNHRVSTPRHLLLGLSTLARRAIHWRTRLAMCDRHACCCSAVSRLSLLPRRCRCQPMGVWRRSRALGLLGATGRHAVHQRRRSSRRWGRWVCSCCDSCRALGNQGSRGCTACQRGRLRCPTGSDVHSLWCLMW